MTARVFLGLVLLISMFRAAEGADRTGVTKDSIKIGLFGTLTGPASLYRKGVYGAASIYSDVNDKGGINGRKLELIIEDDGCDASKGIAAVKKLISEDEVFLLHGPICSAVALPVKPIILARPEIPWVSLGATSNLLSTPTYPNIFQPVITAKTTGEQMAAFGLSKPGAKRVGVIRHSDEWSGSYFDPTIEFLKSRGIEPVIIAHLERGSADAAAQVAAIKQAEPDFVLAFLYPAEFAVYLRDAYKYKLNTITITTHAISIDDVDKQVGIPAAIKELYIAYPLKNNITSPQLSPFLQVFRKYYPSESIDMHSMYTMGGAISIVEALRRTGQDLTRERFMEEMNNLRNFETGVSSGPVTFTPEDHAGVKAIKMITKTNRRVELFDTYPASQ
jgi:branched-chain amino acid transport system substrate-binding protein